MTREEWGAKEPVESPVSISQTNMTFLHHTAGTTWACTDKQKCIEDVKSIQDLHVDGNGRLHLVISTHLLYLIYI